MGGGGQRQIKVYCHGIMEGSTDVQGIYTSDRNARQLSTKIKEDLWGIMMPTQASLLRIIFRYIQQGIILTPRKVLLELHCKNTTRLDSR